MTMRFKMRHLNGRTVCCDTHKCFKSARYRLLIMDRPAGTFCKTCRTSMARAWRDADAGYTEYHRDRLETAAIVAKEPVAA